MADTYRLQKPSPPKEEPTEPSAPKSQGKSRPKKGPGRLVSLDAYRGFIMMMLAASGFGIAKFAALPQDHEVWKVWHYETFQRISFHFSHPPWESITGFIGVSFWDLIQPAFMFMVGVAMPFSFGRRTARGSSRLRRCVHAASRSLVLVLLGVFLYSLGKDQTNWIFTNVLAQIGLGYFFTYLLLGQSARFQMVAIGVILVGYWGFFMMNPPPADFDYAAVNASEENGEVYSGRFAPWSKNANAGHFFDVWLLNALRAPRESEPPPASEDDSEESGETASPAAPEWNSVPQAIRSWWFSAPERYEFNRGGYLTLNFIPSIATTLLGVLCGQLLLSESGKGRRLLLMLTGGAVCLGLGILAHHSVCPIVKRIWTPSWVLFSGGYVIWMLAAFYFLFDILPLRKLAFPLVVVGMNSLVMYLMGQMMRPWVIDNVVITHFGRMLSSLLGPGAIDPDNLGAAVLPTCAFLVFWLITWWMYRHRYFVRI